MNCPVIMTFGSHNACKQCAELKRRTWPLEKPSTVDANGESIPPALAIATDTHSSRRCPQTSCGKPCR